MTADPAPVTPDGTPAGAPSRLPESLQALRSPPYRVFAAGALLSGMGNWAVRLAQLLMVLASTGGSGAAAGLLAALQYVPLMVLGGPIGALADRRPKTHVLAGGLSVMAASALVEGLLVLRGTVSTSVGMLLALTFGIGAAVDNSLRIAVAPELVPPADISNAVNLNFVSIQLSRLVGPALAGVVMGLWGPAPAYLVAAAAMFGYAFVLVRLSVPFAATRRSIDGSIRAGLAYVRADPDLLLIFFVIGMSGLLGPNLATISALVVSLTFGGTAAQAGAVTAVLSIGTVLGAIRTTRHPSGRIRTVVLAAISLGAASVACSLAPTVVVFAILLLPAGFAALLMVSQAGSLIQTGIDPAFRGRVTSLFAIVLVVGVPIGSPLYGVLTEWLGAQGALAVLGVVVVVSAAGAALFRRRGAGRLSLP